MAAYGVGTVPWLEILVMSVEAVSVEGATYAPTHRHWEKLEMAGVEVVKDVKVEVAVTFSG